MLPMGQEPTDTSKQPTITRYLGHVTGYQPIRDQYFLIRSVSHRESHLPVQYFVDLINTGVNCKYFRVKLYQTWGSRAGYHGN